MLVSLRQYCGGFGTAALKTEGWEAFIILILTEVHNNNLSFTLVYVFLLVGMLKQDRGKRKDRMCFLFLLAKSSSVAQSLSPAKAHRALQQATCSLTILLVLVGGAYPLARDS